MLYAAVVILFNEKDEILIVKRSPAVETYIDHWCFPGGGADDGETAVECAVRETFEETSIKVNPKTLIYLDTTIKDDDKEVHFFASLDWKGEVKIDWESSDYKWVTPSEIKDLKFIPTPDILIQILEIWINSK